MFLGTSRARWAVVVTRTVSGREGALLARCIWPKTSKTCHRVCHSSSTYWWRFSRTEGPRSASRREATPSPQCWVSFLPDRWTESYDWCLHVASEPRCTGRSPLLAPYPSGASESKMRVTSKFRQTKQFTAKQLTPNTDVDVQTCSAARASP